MSHCHHQPRLQRRNISQTCSFLSAGPSSGGPDNTEGGGGGSSQLLCPKCGSPCEHVATFISSTRSQPLSPLLNNCRTVPGLSSVTSAHTSSSSCPSRTRRPGSRRPGRRRLRGPVPAPGSPRPTPRKFMNTLTLTSLDRRRPRKPCLLLCTTTTRGSITTSPSTRSRTSIRRTWQLTPPPTDTFPATGRSEGTLLLQLSSFGSLKFVLKQIHFSYSRQQLQK